MCRKRFKVINLRIVCEIEMKKKNVEYFILPEKTDKRRETLEISLRILSYYAIGLLFQILLI